MRVAISQWTGFTRLLLDAGQKHSSFRDLLRRSRTIGFSMGREMGEWLRS